MANVSKLFRIFGERYVFADERRIVSRPASRAEQRADIKNRPAPHDEGRGENETPHICPTIENEKE